MHIITKSRLKDFWKTHPRAETPLRAWLTMARQARWVSIAGVRRVHPKADKVGSLTVFDIGGNKYRLIVNIDYKMGRIYIRHVLTHAEYNRGRWKDQEIGNEH